MVGLLGNIVAFKGHKFWKKNPKLELVCAFHKLQHIFIETSIAGTLLHALPKNLIEIECLKMF